MKPVFLIPAVWCVVAAATSVTVWAADPAAPAIGRQLMSAEEQAAQRAKMQTATTTQERDAIRQANHTAMQERAKAQGVALPDAPLARGAGAAGAAGAAGVGQGAQGTGQARGAGMGQGGNR